MFRVENLELESRSYGNKHKNGKELVYRVRKSIDFLREKSSRNRERAEMKPEKRNRVRPEWKKWAKIAREACKMIPTG